jgi:para-aminobenzoate synthetase component 1
VWGAASSRFVTLAWDVERVGADEVMDRSLGGGGAVPAMPKWEYFSLLPYDGGAEEKHYRVNRAFVFDQLEGKMHRLSFREETSSEPVPKEIGAKSAGIQLSPLEDEQNYLAKVENVVSDIRKGRYYELNLLRYFACGDVSREELVRRYQALSGPKGCWIKDDDGELISMSPETFVTLEGNRINCYPVKGTAPVAGDPAENERIKRDLLGSPKDGAELGIIVDLIRNDLAQVCEWGSVQVEAAKTLHSHETVHHLVANISGTLRSDLTVKEIFTRIRPAGSITGAPKKEVMKAIREYESRDRGYFMGNVVAYDFNRGRLDSSILIRTMENFKKNRFYYAAGSGIVISSSPEQELAEICTKCKVLTAGI